jgi:hypothetical protein
VKKYLIILTFISFFSNIHAQDSLHNDAPLTRKTITVTAGPEYDISGFSEVFLGEHWRRLWVTPFEAEVLDLNTFAGGLTPYKQGGGLQTKSLRFKGNDGKEYKFRSINKDPKKLLPPDLQGTFVADAVQDQISTSHPFSAMIVAPILNSVGILNARPFVVVLPDDDKLDKYKKDFGGVLGTLEENPNEGEDGEPGFAGADKVVSSEKLYERLEKDNDEQVDKTEFLKARLVDIFLGDWDRHSDQWRWAGYKDGDKIIWKPIPRDRDQAFCLYDGIIPSIVGRAITQIEGYKEDYPPAYDLTFNGRHLDRRFLPSLEKNVWDSLALFIQARVTDSVIENAVRTMPEEWYRLEGGHLIELIKARRNGLKEASDEYYELIAGTVDIYGSDKGEYTEVKRLNDDKVEVTLYKRDKETGERTGEVIFHRTFNTNETDEVRIYLRGGKDKTVVTGNVDSSIPVRIIGGGGDDELVDNSKVSGWLFSFLPVPSAEISTLYYTRGDDKKIKKSASTSVYKDEELKVTLPIQKYEPPVENRGYDWRFAPGFGYTSDDGIIVGGGPILYKFGFRTVPYVYRLELVGAYSTKLKSYAVHFTGDFYSIIKGVRTGLEMNKTELKINKFYGTGNNTILDKDLDNREYYKLGQELVNIHPFIELQTSGFTFLNIGLFYKYSDIEAEPNTFLQQNMPYGEGVQKFAGINSSFRWDSRDNALEPNRGFYAELHGSYSPKLFKLEPYTKAGYDVRAYFTANTFKGVTLALRTAGEKVWGTFPFYESAFLGGISSLRGFASERFAGDASLIGQAELRMKLFNVSFIIPGQMGISMFGETGRVFSKGEDSKLWHPSYGGSLWMSYLDRQFNFGVTGANSKEGFKLYIGSAFHF